MKKKTALFIKAILSVLAAVCFAFAIGCGGKKPVDNGGKKPDDKDKVTPISLVTGFENDESLGIITCGGGTTKSRNTDKNYVLNGNGSLKLAVADYAEAKFSFSDNVIEKKITDYDYISFWLYSEYDGVIQLSNTAGNAAIGDLIKGNTWTKIKIDKTMPVFNIIKYNLAYNSFVLSAAGTDAGKVVKYNVYIDDIRLYKDGMTGECELLFASENNGYTAAPDNAIAGVEYTLPEVVVFSPEGYRIHGADENVVKKITDAAGNEVKIENGKTQIDKAGEYSLICSYTYDGIDNKIITDLNVLFVEADEVYTGMHVKGDSVTLPELKVTDPATGDVATGVQTSVKVTKPDGSDFDYAGAFTADTVGKYKVVYTVTGKANGTDNVFTYETYLWVTETGGLVADFSSGEASMFGIDVNSRGIVLEESTENCKRAKNGNTASLKAVVKGNKAPRIAFTENFPVKNIDGAKYLSMWVYNGSAIELTAELTNCNGVQKAKAGAWSLLVFKAENFFADFRGQEIMFYDAVNQNAINCNLFIDDVRIIREGDPEEVMFSDKLTVSDYNPADRSGRRFSLNTEYEIDLTLKTVSGEAVSGRATVESVKDKRNRNLTVKDGKLFTPTTVGLHTVALSYEYNGILNTIEKTADATEQVLISPDGKFILKPGEQNIKYNFDTLPEIWNHGVLDNDMTVEITAYDDKNNEVAITGNAFTPTAAGRYQIFILAKDKQDARENALLETSLLIYEAGKFGIIADFEDGDPTVMESARYYYGDISNFQISEDVVHSGTKSGVIYNRSDDTESIFFNFAVNNRAGDISETASFSFWIYVDDPHGDNTYTIGKCPYAGWVNERDPSYVIGSLRQSFTANRWVEIKVLRKDYETVLGGTIFAGAPGGWTSAVNDFITSFIVYGQGRLNKDIKIYVDDFVLGY